MQKRKFYEFARVAFFSINGTGFCYYECNTQTNKTKKKERKRSGFYNLEFQEEKEVISALFKNIH